MKLTFLPPEARAILITAAQTEGERERRFAIDDAIDAVRARWPECFVDEGSAP